MRERSEVAKSMAVLRERGLLYNQDGAEWYRRPRSAMTKTAR